MTTINLWSLWRIFWDQSECIHVYGGTYLGNNFNTLIKKFPVQFKPTTLPRQLAAAQLNVSALPRHTWKTEVRGLPIIARI